MKCTNRCSHLKTITSLSCQYFAALKIYVSEQVSLQDVAATLKKLVTMGKKTTELDRLKESIVSVDDVLKEAWAEMKKKSNHSILIMNFIRALIRDERYECHFETLNNEL